MKKLLTILFLFIFASVSFAVEKSKPQAPETIKRIDTMLAVFDLETTGKVEKDISRPLTDSIRLEVVKTKKYKIIDRSNMDKILGEQKLQLSGCVSGECIVEAGQLLGVGKIITGSVSIVGKTYYLSLQLVNVESGQIENVSEDKCKCEIDDLIDSSKRLVKKLLGEKIEAPKEAVAAPEAAEKEPPQNSFSLEGLEQKAKEETKRKEKEKQLWNKKTEDMRLAYNKVLEYEKKENISHEIKANAWKHFSDAFKEDNPHSREDDTAKEKAKVQIEYWQNMAKRKGNPAEVKDTATGMEFVYVDGGCYQMGDTFGDGGSSEKPVHEVCVDDFYIGKYEVTQGQWKAIMGDNPSKFDDCGDNCPVEKVSWDDIQEFINKLNQKMKNNPQAPSVASRVSDFVKGEFRLPTEAEWEYAARSGGKSEKYSGSNDIDSVAWYDKNSGSKTHPVGTKQPNGLGIYDMSGNVWEWVNDWYDGEYYKNSPKNNTTGPSSGKEKVLRGGSWYNLARFTLTANRYRHFPDYRNLHVGFRVARTK